MIHFSLHNDWRCAFPGVRLVHLELHVGPGWFFAGVGLLGLVFLAEAGVETFREQVRR